MSIYTKHPTTIGNLEATVLAIRPDADLAVVKQLTISFHMATKLCVWSSGDTLILRIRLKDIGVNPKVQQFLSNSTTAVSYYTPGFVWVCKDISKRDLTTLVEEIRVQDEHHTHYNQWIQLQHEAFAKTETSEEVIAKTYNLRRAFIDNIVFVDCCVPPTSTTPVVPGRIVFDYKGEKITLYYRTRNATEAAYFELLEAMPY